MTAENVIFSFLWLPYCSGAQREYDGRVVAVRWRFFYQPFGGKRGPAVRQQQNMSDCRLFIDNTCPGRSRCTAATEHVGLQAIYRYHLSWEVQLHGSNRTCRTAGYLSISLVLGGPAVRQQQNMSDCRPFIDITCPAFLQSNKAQYRTLLTSSLATNVHCISVPSALLPLTLQTDTSYSDRSRQRAGLCFVR